MRTYEILEDAGRRARAYCEQIQSRRVAPTREAVEGLSNFDCPLPERSMEENEVLAMLDEFGSPATVGTTSGRYFGFVIGGCLPVTVAANILAAAWDECAGRNVVSPLGGRLEEVALRWLIELFGLPQGCAGGFVTGATMANFVGLAAARHAVLERAGWDVEAQGLQGAPPINVVVGDEVHVSVLQGISLLGLGAKRVARVPVDQQGRMIAAKLPTLSPLSIICTQIGNVNTGGFDPVAEVIEQAREVGAWVHVDGAFGLWIRTDPKRADLAHGIENADSWATDAHKWLNVPYDSGVVFCKHDAAIRGAMAECASYLVAGEGREPSHYTPELSRRARGIEIWAALKTLGRAGVSDLISRSCEHAQHFASLLQRAGFEVLNEVVANQVLVSFGESDKTQRIIRAIQDNGTCWCGGTIWQGRSAMRISVSSWATTSEDVVRSAAAIIQAAERS